MEKEKRIEDFETEIKNLNAGVEILEIKIQIAKNNIELIKLEKEYKSLDVNLI